MHSVQGLHKMLQKKAQKKVEHGYAVHRKYRQRETDAGGRRGDRHSLFVVCGLWRCHFRSGPIKTRRQGDKQTNRQELKGKGKQGKPISGQDGYVGPFCRSTNSSNRQTGRARKDKEDKGMRTRKRQATGDRRQATDARILSRYYPTSAHHKLEWTTHKSVKSRIE